MDHGFASCPGSDGAAGGANYLARAFARIRLRHMAHCRSTTTFLNMKTTLFAIVTGIIIALCSCASTGGGPADQKLPPGAIREGSLANQKLIQDTTAGVFQKLMSKGHDMMGEHKIMPYVMSTPSGSKGARHWTEQWYVQVKKDWIPVMIEFKESGSGNADWSIR
jgi:hypothetical protein